MRAALAIVFGCLIVSNLSAQVMSDQQFYALILKNHPLAKQAGLKLEMGESQVLKAKGGFDPKVYTDYGEKNFANTSYFQKLNSGVYLPTWYGIQLKSGFESNRGTFVNPENKTPYGGLFYGGVSLSLGQGLMMDQRRAELFKAQLYQESTSYEQALMLNQLVYESGYAYWNWFLAHHSEKVLRESYQLALLRFNAVKLAAEGGDRPYIDTIEARIQVQSRNALWKSYETEELNARVKVSTYLWNEQLEPLDLAASKMPMEENETALPLSRFPSIMELDSLIAHHPYLKMNNLKIKTLEIDQKLKKEQLKPVLNLNYQVINEPVNYNPLYSFSPNNNKFGVQFEMPILLRKERGDLQLSKLKIQDEQLTFTSNQVYIQSKIEQAQNDYLNAQAQVQIYQQSVMDSRTLFEAEKRMFEQGESSLFLVNARELTYIQAKLKYLEVLTKCQQAALSYEFSLARLIP